MVQETTTSSASPKVENSQSMSAQSENTTAPDSRTVSAKPVEATESLETVAVSTSASLTPYSTQTQLQELESRLNTKLEQNKAGGTGLLWCVSLIAIAVAAYSGYTAFNNQNKLALLENSYQQNQSVVESAKRDLDTAVATATENATLIKAAQNTNANLQAQNSTLIQNYNNLAAQLNEVIAKQNVFNEVNNETRQMIAHFEERNPFDWQLAESFFLVNNATKKAIFEKDIKAAIWMLTKADELLVNMETEDVVALREAISKDISSLKTVGSIDYRGLGLSLDRAYDAVDSLVLIGYSDPKLREQAFAKEESTSSNIQDWKENLTKSANNFASRFIEIRRRDNANATEFLTPAQDVYLRENIKTRILMAKSNLAHGEKEQMQSNLQEAIKLVKTYFEPESSYTTALLETLNTLNQSEITIEMPEVLESTNAFATFANEHLIGRGI